MTGPLARLAAALWLLLQVVRLCHCSEHTPASGDAANGGEGSQPTTTWTSTSATSAFPVGYDSSLRQELKQSRPGPVQWVLSIVLASLLLGHLVRVWRVVRGDNTLVVQRSAPEGHRTVQCGQCQRMQYLQSQGRIFICFSCRSANRLTMDFPRSPSSTTTALELTESTGPCKRYELKKQGELLWQVVKQEDVDEEPVVGAPLLTDGRTTSSDNVVRATQDDSSETSEKSQSDGMDLGAEPVSRDAEDGGEACGAGRGGSRDRRPKRRPGVVWDVCGVCWDLPGCMVLLPCSHGNVCQECATRIAQNRASGGAHCPHCRANIHTLVRLTEAYGENFEFARGMEHRVPIARVTARAS